MSTIYKAEINHIIKETGNQGSKLIARIEADDEALPKRVAALLTFAEGTDTSAFEEGKLPPFYSMMAALSIKNQIMRDLIPHSPPESKERIAAEKFVNETDNILEIGDTMGRRFENHSFAPEGYKGGLPRSDK